MHFFDCFQNHTLMKSTVRFQLSLMMFLNFFIWGIWFVTMGTYLTKGSIAASDSQAGLAYGTQALGAIIAPFIMGLIADKYFAAQKLLGLIHLAGAVLMYFIYQQSSFDSFYSLLLGYMIIFMPTLALVNAIALKQMDSPEKQFSLVRVWGTIGWIVAGVFVGKILGLEQKAQLQQTFLISSGVSVVLGVLSFFLPNTPPPKAGTTTTVREILGLDALALLKDKNYLIFFLSSVLICIPLAFYYQETNKFLNELQVPEAAFKMSWGQMSETLFLFLMPLFFTRLGVKKMLLIGMLAWVVRYLCFDFGNADSMAWMLYIGIILHGICYDFFFVTGQIYTDERAGERIRSSAQGMITLATYGVGMLIGFWFAGMVTEHYKTADGHDWQKVWIIPAAFAGVVTLLFLIFFKEPKKQKA